MPGFTVAGLENREEMQVILQCVDPGKEPAWGSLGISQIQDYGVSMTLSCCVCLFLLGDKYVRHHS